MIDLKAARAEPERFRAAVARKGAGEAFDRLLEADRRWRELVPQVDELRGRQKIQGKPTPEQVEELSKQGFVVIGDPDDCARSVQNWVDMGFDQLTFSPTTNTLPLETIVNSMELFGKEVLPQFDKDPVHSTTKYREAASK